MEDSSKKDEMSETKGRQGSSRETPDQIKPQAVFPSGQLGSVTRKINEIRKLMGISDNLGTVETEFVELEERLQKLDKALKEELDRLDISNFEKSRLMKWANTKSEEISSYKAEICGWIAEERNKIDIGPGDSISVAGSQRSNRSRVSQASSMARVRLAENQAKIKAREELAVKMQSLQKERKLILRNHEERERRILQAREDDEERFKALEAQLKIESEKSELEHLQKALDHLEMFGGDQPGKIEEKEVIWFKDKPTTNTTERDEVPMTYCDPVRNHEEESNLTHQIALLAEIAERSHLPKSEPEIFDGTDPTLYHSFIQAFDRLIGEKTRSNSDKLYYLEKYTKGDPRSLVRSCIHVNRDLGYQQARELLQKEYGNEFHIANAFLKKIQEWPSIKLNDTTALKRFGTFLRTCENSMSDVSALNQLNSPSQIQAVAMKLPFKLRDRWRTHAFTVLSKSKFIKFEDLSSFVVQQAEIVSMPIFGEIDELDSSNIQGNATKRALSMATNGESHCGGQLCAVCKKDNHSVADCFFFAKKSEKEKLTLIQSQGLCFGCLIGGHISRYCTQRLKCNLCQKWHPTCLHHEDQARDVGTASGPSKVRDSMSACCVEKHTFHTRAGTSRRISLAIVPVRIRVKGSKSDVITYAGLDNFSSDCFITESLLQDLKISGPKTTIKLTTMQSVQMSMRTRAISGLEVLDLDGNHVINLSVVFSKDCLPISGGDIATRKDWAVFPQFVGVPVRFVEARVGLLLGANAPEAIKPLEIVSGPEFGPYASRHKLGWALNGPICLGESSDYTAVANRIKVEADDIVQELKRMYLSDFKDSEEDECGPSLEDAKWLKKIQGSICKDDQGHYSIGLPFRKESTSVGTDNLSQALQMKSTVKRKLERNPTYRADYEEFMDMMIRNDFSEHVPANELGSKNVRYIVHHGVYHKQKRKLRVVFNCSLKFAGVSLNDELLPGPDMTNNLLGILLRFRQGEIAITGDIEKMYYQVRVPKEDRDFLRYLWFPNGRLDLPPVEFRLKVHVFGAVSSPSCATFALRQAAIDCEPISGEMPAQIVRRDFYVDDMLTSVDSVQVAKQAVTT